MTLKLQRGFTLIEMLVVIAIISILIGIGVNTFVSAQKKARDVKREAQLKDLKTALELYYLDHGHYYITGSTWYGETPAPPCPYNVTTQDYIPELAPTYIKALPHDPRANENCAGFHYRSTDGSGYKVLLHQSAEAPDRYNPGKTFFDHKRTNWSWMICEGADCDL